MATLSECTHDGRPYYNEHNDFGLDIPAGAIPERQSITIDIGVALYGPFQFPKSSRPVSPLFWICVRNQKDYQFLKPVNITIPHCLNLEDCNDIVSLGLTFLKGDHEIKPRSKYQFQQAEGDILIEPLTNHGVIKTTHFCSLCITCENNMKCIEKTQFCIYSVIPREISPNLPSDAYFFITFLLNTCLTTVKKQIKKLNLIGYKEKLGKFQFNEGIQALEILLPQSVPDEWRIALQLTEKVVDHIYMLL